MSHNTIKPCYGKNVWKKVTLLIVLLWDTIQEKFLGEVESSGLLTNCWRLCNADDAITTYYTCCILNSNNW